MEARRISLADIGSSGTVPTPNNAVDPLTRAKLALENARLIRQQANDADAYRTRVDRSIAIERGEVAMATSALDAVVAELAQVTAEKQKMDEECIVTKAKLLQIMRVTRDLLLVVDGTWDGVVPLLDVESGSSYSVTPSGAHVVFDENLPATIQVQLIEEEAAVAAAAKAAAAEAAEAAAAIDNDEAATGMSSSQARSGGGGRGGGGGGGSSYSASSSRRPSAAPSVMTTTTTSAYSYADGIRRPSSMSSSIVTGAGKRMATTAASTTTTVVETNNKSNQPQQQPQQQAPPPSTAEIRLAFDVLASRLADWIMNHAEME